MLKYSLLGNCLITWPLFKFPYPKEFFHCLQFSSHLFSLCLSYSLLDHSHSILAINLPGISLENTFLSSSSFCHHTSLVSLLYSFSNSSTNSFAFSKFSLLFHVSSSIAYPFYHTKNFFFSLTILLFSIFSTSNSSFPLIITGFGSTFFCPSTCGLYRCT